ncbi:L-serine ammonia-lyase [Kitasatospora sp. NPDC089913]|uniref:L-serine ammonia-lyase n=1 Tax=Kitasatospora sp. NPDC089913 TaxID=3364080 RepID=UPI003823583B
MISVFDLFRVGIGPSSSHTVGPMRAARHFVQELDRKDLLVRVAAVRTELFGSLAATCTGHGTDRAVLLGLAGEEPATVDITTAEERFRRMEAEGRVRLPGGPTVRHSLVLHPERSLPAHPNALTFTALGRRGAVLAERTAYSVGGGFLLGEAGEDPAGGTGPADVPAPFSDAEELLRLAGDGRISDVVLANETARRPEAEVRAHLLQVWAVMRGCVERGHRTGGTLPGGLDVPRRAPALHRRLVRADGRPADPLRALDLVALDALAVNEENAAGGRVVTAPTNGAAGIVPAVLHHYHRSTPGADEEGTVRFLLTAAAIGSLVKRNASISGAEVGCQGEVGTAAAMAAAGLTEVLGGTPGQVENAAEIALEHHLGLTCDPVAGLVQIPCIERNAIGSVKAVTASRLALNGDGRHLVPLDAVIRTLRDTGADMKSTYKETSRGGLALHVPRC